ncbi:solute carrier family 7 member 14-like isoform X1 [Branchiostoma floridae x Branchiostoma japonicum]
MGIRNFNPQRMAEGLRTRVFRTKPLDSQIESEAIPMTTKFQKCLTTRDLTSLGVGSCVGTGMYVVSGLVARNMAGPGVVMSFAIAAVASLLSGVCYAEFGVRVPKTTGSAYTYSYVTVGEFVAFVIGWNLILEYLIGTAAGASALSSMFDTLSGHAISKFMISHIGFAIGKAYPDILAFFIGILITIILALGVKNSIGFNNILNVINFAVWVFIMVAGLFFVNGKHWTKDGFFPYGTSGVFHGAATCFYAFIGFDIIATTGEEAKNASRSIPLAIVGSLLICLTAYVSVSAMLTLIDPYDKIDTESPLIGMFVHHHYEPAKYIVALGAISGLTVSLLGSLFPMPRVIYAMANDGLLFRFLARVHERTKTPVLATVISGFLAATLALLVSLQDLIEMMSIGTLLAYTLVSVCVLILRFQPDVLVEPGNEIFDDPIPMGERVKQPVDNTASEGKVSEDTVQTEKERQEQDTMYDDDDSALIPGGGKGLMQGQVSYGTMEKGAMDEKEPESWFTPHINKIKQKLGPVVENIKIRLGIPLESAVPTEQSARIVSICVVVEFIGMFVWCAFIITQEKHIYNREGWAVILAILMACFNLVFVYLILRQPPNRRKLKFMAPCVPLLPICAMLCNIYLMLKLSPITWIRFVVWFTIGLFIYFGYGIWNSNIESRVSDIGRPSGDGKTHDSVVIDTSQIEKPAVQPKVLPAHNPQSKEEFTADQAPILDEDAVMQ